MSGQGTPSDGSDTPPLRIGKISTHTDFTQVATKDGVLIVRPSVTLDLNTNARNLRAFNKFKTAKASASWDANQRHACRVTLQRAHPTQSAVCTAPAAATVSADVINPFVVLYIASACLIEIMVLNPTADAGRRAQAVRRFRVGPDTG